MPAVFHVFKEFANDFHDVKFFAVDVRYRYFCRFLQFWLPVGMWVILITQAKDLATYTAPYLSPLFAALWALSILGGPLVAIITYALHAMPLQEPLPSSILLAVEFGIDSFFFLMWLLGSCITAGVLHGNGLDCPYIMHPVNDYYSDPVPLGNATVLQVFVTRNHSTATMNGTTVTSHGLMTAYNASSNASHTSLASASVTHVATSIVAASSNIGSIRTVSPTSTNTSSIRFQTVVESSACYPILQNLSIFLGILTFTFLVNMALDAHSYIKGMYWDYQDFAQRSRAETMATLRKAEKYGAGAGMGIGKGEYARSRTGSRVGAGANRSRNPSMAGSKIGASMGGSYGSSLNLLAAGDGTPKGSNRGSVTGASRALTGAVAGRLGTFGSGSMLALDSSGSVGGSMKRVDSLSNVKGPSGLTKVVEAEFGVGLGALKDFKNSPNPKASPAFERRRAGSVSSLMKRGGK